MPFSKIAIVGATGALGSRVLNSLARGFDPSSITVLTRQGFSSHTIYPEGVKVVALPSYEDHDAVVSALRSHDVLISVLSHKALDVEYLLAQAAIEAGVRRFMPSEYTMDVGDPVYRELGTNPFARKRIEWADRLATICAEGKISYTTLVTGPFVDLCLSSGFWRFDIKSKKGLIVDDGSAVGTGCTLNFTGDCVASVLKMPEEETRNKRIQISEVEYTGQSILAAFEEATDSKWDIEKKTMAQMAVEEKNLADEGDVSEAYETWIVRMNLCGIGPTRLEEGLHWNNSGKYQVRRRTLKGIIRDIVKDV
ncbi:hypothetical protein MMC25_005860 [Agyrium rufum]|nr:hypothetical protein [Agyrium rufum]